MITLLSGTLFASDAQVLVNTVNCVGVMGKGIALEFKTRFPEILAPYQRACRTGTLVPGVIDWHPLADGRWVANFPTKVDWRNPSELRWIEDGLPALVAGMRERGLKSVALPALGCTNGGLSFSLVRPLIEAVFADLPDLNAELYTPLDPAFSDASSDPADPVVPFGPWKGQRLSQLPKSQLLWLSANAYSASLRAAAAARLTASGS